MDQTVMFAVFVLVTLIVSLVGALLPQMIKMNDKQTHLLIAFSSGIFVGVLFLMFLPEAVEESIEAGYSSETIMYAVMGGFHRDLHHRYLPEALQQTDLWMQFLHGPSCTRHHVALCIHRTVHTRVFRRPGTRKRIRCRYRGRGHGARSHVYPQARCRILAVVDIPLI